MLCTIVGMGPGISLAIARRFSREGFRIGMIARNAGKLDALAVPNSTAIAADASNPAALQAAIESCGPADVLVYNASSLHPGPVSKLAPADLIADFQVNVVGAAVAAQSVLPGMRERKHGTIFFTGGGLALDPHPDYASLAVGKAGIRNLAFSLAKECEPQGIHVATITICGFVQEGTHFAPDVIAGEYWRIYSQPAGHWDRELIYR